MVAISRRSTLLAASVSLALISISPSVEAAAIAARESSSPAKAHRHAPPTLALPVHAKSHKKNHHKHKAREPDSPQQAFFSIERRREVVLNGDHEHYHEHGHHGKHEKVIVNGKDDHVHIHRRSQVTLTDKQGNSYIASRSPHHHHHHHDKEKVVVNGDHDRVNLHNRSPHHHHHHHDHGKEEVVMNGDHDRVNIHNRSPHHHHHHHDHDKDKVVVNGDHDRVNIHQRSSLTISDSKGSSYIVQSRDHDHPPSRRDVQWDSDSLGEIVLKAGDAGAIIARLAVRPDSTIGADEAGSPAYLSPYDPSSPSRRQTSETDPVRIVFPAKLASSNSTEGQEVETCATYNPNPSTNGTMMAMQCNATETDQQSQKFFFDKSAGTLRPAGSATNASSSDMETRDVNATPVTLFFTSSEPTISEFDDSLAVEDDSAISSSTDTSPSIATETVTNTVTVTNSVASATPTDVSDSPVDALNVAVFGGSTTLTSTQSAPTSSVNAQDVASGIANASTTDSSTPAPTASSSTLAARGLRFVRV